LNFFIQTCIFTYGQKLNMQDILLVNVHIV